MSGKIDIHALIESILNNKHFLIKLAAYVGKPIDDVTTLLKDPMFSKKIEAGNVEYNRIYKLICNLKASYYLIDDEYIEDSTADEINRMAKRALNNPNMFNGIVLHVHRPASEIKRILQDPYFSKMVMTNDSNEKTVYHKVYDFICDTVEKAEREQLDELYDYAIFYATNEVRRARNRLVVIDQINSKKNRDGLIKRRSSLNEKIRSIFHIR